MLRRRGRVGRVEPCSQALIIMSRTPQYDSVRRRNRAMLRALVCNDQLRVSGFQGFRVG